MQQYPEVVSVTVGLLTGLAAGGFSVWFAVRERVSRATSEARSEGEVKIAQLNERATRIPLLEAELRRENEKTQGLAKQVADLGAKLSGIESRSVATLQAEQDKLAFTEQTKQQLLETFQVLANNVLDKKAAQFTDQNKANIEQLLDPLRTKIAEFQEQVVKMSAEDGTGRAVLADQVKQLASLNQQLSDDAKNLATALKGSSKAQGNWGEMILVRVLEAAGLQEGREYDLRETYERDDGRRGQPDVVINLPEGRHLVIDAKVSLTDYDQSVNSTDETGRERAVCRHVESVRRHIKELSEKNYTQLHGLKTLDFVVMFVPIEPAFAAAITADGGLWEAALKKNVLLVSPSALLFVLRTVAILWRQEEQARNVKDIARRGGELYNKLVGFVEEFEKVGKSMRQAQDSFEDARRKLSTGQGNVIRQAEMLRDLGVRPTKSLPQGVVEEAMQETLILPEILEEENTTANREIQAVTGRHGEAAL